MHKNCFCLLILAISCGSQIARGEVVAKDKMGFQIKLQHSIEADSKHVFATILQISQWWNASHTYSGDSKNLSLDLKQKCFLEVLPDGGFVRHLEIANYQPGKTIILTGGLGPLQPMGVYGALTITTTPDDDNKKCELVATYNVSGFSKDGLEALAPVVEGVIAQQFSSLKKVAESTN